MKFPHLFAVALTLDMAFQVRRIPADLLKKAQKAASVKEGERVIKDAMPSWHPVVDLDDDLPIFDRGLISTSPLHLPVTIRLGASENVQTHELQFFSVDMFNHRTGEQLIEAKFDSGSTMIGWWPKDEHRPITESLVLFLDNLVQTSEGIHTHSLIQLRALVYMLRSPITP